MNTVTPNRPDRPAAVNERAGNVTDDTREARPTGPRRDVMNTLLGSQRLSAADVTGGDPYNATGRFFRR